MNLKGCKIIKIKQLSGIRFHVSLYDKKFNATITLNINKRMLEDIYTLKQCDVCKHKEQCEVFKLKKDVYFYCSDFKENQIYFIKKKKIKKGSCLRVQEPLRKSKRLQTKYNACITILVYYLLISKLK